MKPFGAGSATPWGAVFAMAKQAMMSKGKITGHYRQWKDPHSRPVDPRTQIDINTQLDLPEEQDVTTVLRRKRRRPPSRERSDKSSSSSDSEDKIKEPIDSKSLLSRTFRRDLEFTFPVYMLFNETTERWFLSFGTDVDFYDTSIKILSGVNTPIPTDPAYGMDPYIHGEFLSLKKAYRNVLIRGVTYTFQYDWVNGLSNIILALPTLSLSITSAPPISYDSSNEVFRFINYLYEDNTYYQPLTELNSKFTSVDFPSKSIINGNTSVNSWSDCEDLHQSSLSLNLGYQQVPIINPSSEISNYIVGHVSLWVHTEFGTPQLLIN